MLNESKQDNRVGTLITFAAHVDKARVLRWIEKLEKQGLVDGHTTVEYNPYYGEPCWYIP